MINVVSIRLPSGMLKKLKIESKKENVSVSKIVRTALEKYFFRMEFDRVRRKVKMEMIKKNIVLTENQILNEKLEEKFWAAKADIALEKGFIGTKKSMELLKKTLQKTNNKSLMIK